MEIRMKKEKNVRKSVEKSCGNIFDCHFILQGQGMHKNANTYKYFKRIKQNYYVDVKTK